MKKLYVTFFAAILSSVSLSQWTNNSSLNTEVCKATGDQAEARIISDGAGGAIVAWMDSRPAGNTDIYMQRLDSQGFPQWAAGGIVVCNNAFDQSVPALAEDGNNGAIIVWKDMRNGNSDIYAQHVNSAGAIQWAANGIAVDIKSGDQIEPKVESDGINGAIITWQDSVSGNWNIYAQRINSSGALLWSAGGVAVCTAANDQKNPRIEVSSPGESIIVWQDKRNGNDYDIYAQKLNASGAAQWAVNGVAVCNAADTQNNPKIESDGAGGAIIGWADKRNGSDYNVYSQRLNSSGVPQWAANGVAVSVETGNQSAIDISSKNISGAILTWKDYRNNIYADIYAQYLDISGTPQWAANGISVSAKAFDQLNPNIVTDSTGCVIVWQDSSNAQWDVYAQRILLNGTAQWGTNGKVIGNAAKNQIEPKHLSDGKGGAIVVWHDNRDSTTKYDLYAQNINTDGSLGTLGNEELRFQSPGFRVYPNPNKGKFQLISRTGNRAINKIEIYNILGEVIYSSLRHQASEFSVDLSSEPKGIYFYCISGDGAPVQSGRIIIE